MLWHGKDIGNSGEHRAPAIIEVNEERGGVGVRLSVWCNAGVVLLTYEQVREMRDTLTAFIEAKRPHAKQTQEAKSDG